MRKRAAVALILVLIGLLVLTAIAIPANAARLDRPEQVLAGGGAVPPNELFMVSGGTLEKLFPLVARNVGGAPLNVKVVENVPAGIVFLPDTRTVTIQPGQAVTIPYTLRLDSNLAPGRYRVEINVLPANATVTQGIVGFLPAVTQRYSVVVSGESGDIRASALDAVEKKKVTGTFIASRISGVNKTPVAKTTGTELAARVVPGEYEVALEIEGKRITSRQVRVRDGKTTEAELDVSLLQFTEVTAEQIDLNGVIAAMSFAVRFDNSLRPLSDAQISMEVRRDGKTTETVEVQRFQILSMGAGSLATRYVPRQGWLNGKYEFRFRLAAGDISVVAPTRPSVQVGVSTKAGFSPMAIAVAGAIGLLFLATLFSLVLGRRRRHRGGSSSGRDPLAGRRVRRTQVLAGPAEAHRPLDESSQPSTGH